MYVNGWESEYTFSVNPYISEYPKNDESGNIYESGKISCSVNLVLDCSVPVCLSLDTLRGEGLVREKQREKIGTR